MLKANTNEYRRMLLVGEPNIESVWSPPSNEEDTDTADPRFIEWMEKRNTLTSSLDATSVEDCDLEMFFESEEALPIDRTNRDHVVPQERARFPEQSSPLQKELPRSLIHTDTSIVPLTDFAPTTKIGLQHSHQPTYNASDVSSPKRRKKKDMGDARTLGLWTVCQGEELAAFAYDDDDDSDDQQQQQQTLEEINDDKHCGSFTADTSTNPVAPLLSSPRVRNSETSQPVATIFQHADFGTLELNCSSDEE